MSDATQSFYGRWARLYDVLATLPGVRSWRASATDELALDDGDLALEMGCGTGANLPHLRERVGPDGRVVGLDVTRGMLERARGGKRRPAPGRCRTTTDRRTRRRAARHVRRGDVRRPRIDRRRLVRPGPPGGRVALLHFTRSERAWARPVNAAYRAFVWLSSTDKSRVRDVAAGHDRRVDTGLEALAARTTDYRERTLAGGHLRLASGEIA